MNRRFRRGRQPTRSSMLSPLREFLQTEASSGILLAIAAAVAIVWANSPWSSSYERLWSASTTVSIGGHSLHLDARQWVNDGLITIFFFVVGLEVKREIVGGQLSTRRGAFLPIAAALGGMAVPALIYLAIAGGSGPRGWAIVVATDIPLALGVLAIAGDRVPAQLRVFLLAVAIVDDIGSLLIIAAFYSTGIGWGWLAAAATVYAICVIARRAGVPYNWCFVGLGCVLWLTLHAARVNPTLAGVAMALLAPAPRHGAAPVIERLEHRLHPWSSYVIIPVFALANTGVGLGGDALRAAVHSPVTWAIIVGRVVGKPLGILLSTKTAIATGLGHAPRGATNRTTTGVAAAAGMGFTVALFIAELAFPEEVQRSDATIGILASAIVAAATSLTVLGRRDTSQLQT